MINTKTPLLIGILLAVLVITTLTFGILWYQAKVELRSKNQELRALEQQLRVVEEELKEKAQGAEEAETIDISTWQTYRNEKYGFEVRYPDGWNVKTELGGDNIFTFHKISGSDARISVSIDGQPEKIEELAEIKMRKQTNVGGISTEKLLGDFYLAEGREWIVQVKRGSFYYFIYGNGYDAEEEKVFDQFLSTFKFIQ